MRTHKSYRSALFRLFALQVPLIGLFFQTALYAWVYFWRYYPLIRLRLKFYVKGHILVLGIYLLFLILFSHTFEADKVGYYRPFDVILSQVFSLFATDVVSYFQLSLMRNWTMPTGPMWLLFILQSAFAVGWVILSDRIYRSAFPPSKLLLIHGDRPTAGIEAKFASRPDKYEVVDSIGTEEGEDAVIARIRQGGFDGVVLWDIVTSERNELMKYCYANAVRMYIMPKIPDVLVKGASELHLFDTPIYMTREYALSFNQRFVKRAVDVTGALVLLILTSPIFLITAIAVKCTDGGPVFYRQARCTLRMKEFSIIKFRSMRVDAEKDGVARLAAEHDDRITPVGRFIRKCRIDELPQLINVLRGDMSFIGPRPERPEIIAQYVESMPEFTYRTRVKAGLAGYAQIYGKYNTTPYDKLKLDLTYIQNYSIFLDLKLALLTLKILVTPESTEGVEAGQVTALKEEKEQP